MKRILSAVVAALLVFTMVIPVFAAGGDINAYEQKILDKFTKGIDGFSFKAEDIKQAENYFKTVDMTETQETEIIGYIDEAYAIFKASGKNANIASLSAEDRAKFLELGKAAAAVMGLTFTYNSSAKTVEISNAGVPVYATEAIIKTTGGISDVSALIIALTAVAVIGSSLLVVSRKKISFSK